MLRYIKFDKFISPWVCYCSIKQKQTSFMIFFNLFDIRPLLFQTNLEYITCAVMAMLMSRKNQSAVTDVSLLFT